MYRATLIFSYSFSLSGYYTYFWYPIPLSQLRLGYFLSFWPPYPSCRCAPGISCTFGLYTLFSRCALGISYPFGLHTLFPLRGYFLHFGLYTLFPCAWVFPALSASIPFSRCALGIFCTFRTFHTLAILRFCVCRSLTIHRIA